MNILENFTNEFIQLIEKDSLGNIVEYLSQYETNDERVKDENDDKNEDEKKVLLINLINSLAQGLQSYKVENALHDQINKFDTCTQQESMGRECFRSNDFPRIPNLDDLLKNLKPDYPKDLDTEPSLDNFTVSSELNPDIVNLLDNLDDVIAKSFKFSEPEELFQTVPRKKTQKIRKVSKGQGRGKNKKGENGDDELEGSEKGESTLDNDGNQSISGTKKEADEGSISGSSQKKQIPKSAKWMTREGGSAVRSNIQPPEILRCLFNELTANGLIMKSIEPKLAMLQLHENNQVNAENKEMIDAPEASTSNFFSQISAILEEISLKPIGRIASGITTECISGWHDSLDNFDNSWKEISSENVDRQIKIMQSLTGLRSEQIPESAGKSIFPVEEMPASDLIVNPFASIQKDDNPWEYLTELTNPNPTTIKALRTSCDIGGLSVDDPLADSTISAIRESKVHPFIHPESMFFGKVNVGECLNDIQFSTLISSSQSRNITLEDKLLESNIPNGHIDDNSGVRTRKKRPHQDIDPNNTNSTPKLIEEELIPSYWVHAIAKEIPIPGKKIKLSVDECATLVNVKEPSVDNIIQMGACFQFCVERSTALLNMGHNIIVVDKTLQPPTHENEGKPIPHLGHRIRLISSIIRSNIGTIDYFNASKSKRKKNTPISRWGPILIIVKLKDLLIWEEILRKECNNNPIQVSSEILLSRPLRILSYYGNITDRALLRSYLNSSSLYTEKSPCHIILTHYEALFSDIYYFKLIRWQMVILDEGWSIISNYKNKHLLDEINSLQIRHKIISCSSLIQPNYDQSTPSSSSSVSFYPDIYSTIQFLFPSLWNVLDLQNSLYFSPPIGLTGGTISQSQSQQQVVHSNNIELITKRLLQQLCSSLTAICDEEISNLVHGQSLDTDEDTIQYYDIVENLPWYEWEGINVRVIPNYKINKNYQSSTSSSTTTTSTSSSSSSITGKYQILYDFKKIDHTNTYTDLDITNEFNSIPIDNLGKYAEINLKKLKQKIKLVENETISNGKKKKKSSSGSGSGSGSSGIGVVSSQLETTDPSNESEQNKEGDSDSKILTEDVKDIDDSIKEIDGNEQILLKEEPVVSVPVSADKQTPVKVIKRKITTSGSTPSSKPKAAMIRHFDPEEELTRSVAMRGDRWQVTLSFPGRVRFLGLYRTEEAAMKAYLVALQQRRTLFNEGITYLPRIKFVGDAIGGFEGSLAPPSLSKKRRVHEIFSEQEILERSSDDCLEKAVGDMIAPHYYAGLEVAGWDCPDHPPPAYAMLQGPKGFVAFVVHKKTILGKFFTSTIELARNIGVGDPIGLGGYHTDSSVDIHLGDDTSIARQHAIIKFNEIKSCFEIETFYPIYVHGEKVIPEQGPVSLSNRTVIQIGCKIFYFVLPMRNNPMTKPTLYRTSEPEKADIPQQSLRSIANVLLESIKLRRKGCNLDGSLISDFLPSSEEIVNLNNQLDEITKLQEHLFPTPRGGKAIVTSTNAGAKKRVRDEEMFMRSVISDVDKATIRPILPPPAARSPPGINPAILLKMGPPMLVGTPPAQVDDDQVSVDGDVAQIPQEIPIPPTTTDDGIKYAKMPPALRPERPKKVEKAKVTKPVAPPSQPLQIPPQMGAKKPELPRPLLAAGESITLPYPPYPRGPRGPLGPALPRGVLPRPIYQQIRPAYPPPAGSIPPRASVPNLPVGARPIYSSPAPLSRQLPSPKQVEASAEAVETSTLPGKEDNNNEVEQEVDSNQ